MIFIVPMDKEIKMQLCKSKTFSKNGLIDTDGL